MDESSTVTHLRRVVQQFVSERDWEPFQSPRNLCGSIAIEAAELLEVYQWLTDEQAAAAAHESTVRQRTREELADVVIYCLALANTLEIDLSQAIHDKMIANAAKYPVESSRGRL